MAAKTGGRANKSAPKDLKKVIEKPEAVKTRSPLSFRKKLIIIGVVLALAYALFASKDLFVAATVNGYPIPRVSVVRELEQQGGQQVLDNLINEALIVQEARKAGVTVTEADIDVKVEEVTKQVGDQGQDLDTLLSSQGMSKENFRKQIKTQLYVEKLLGDKVAITDEQIASFIETNKSFLPTDLDEEGLKNLARQELTQQELTGQYSTWIAEIKQSANINYFVEY